MAVARETWGGVEGKGEMEVIGAQLDCEPTWGGIGTMSRQNRRAVSDPTQSWGAHFLTSWWDPRP